mmetsp:Transcript_6958/g.13634  ORF Transcript_6958/g.13634 Transcript_6958/m.13634 type:complete len:238 (+) Transcript_6958:1591-2304(+)
MQAGHFFEFRSFGFSFPLVPVNQLNHSIFTDVFVDHGTVGLSIFAKIADDESLLGIRTRIEPEVVTKRLALVEGQLVVGHPLLKDSRNVCCKAEGAIACRENAIPRGLRSLGKPSISEIFHLNHHASRLDLTLHRTVEWDLLDHVLLRQQHRQRNFQISDHVIENHLVFVPHAEEHHWRLDILQIPMEAFAKLGVELHIVHGLGLLLLAVDLDLHVRVLLANSLNFAQASASDDSDP